MNGPGLSSLDSIRNEDAGNTRRLRILTWHVHGNYLYALGHLPHEFIVPVTVEPQDGYGALGPGLAWGANMREVRPEELKEQSFDCVIYQSRANWDDASKWLTEEQRRLPSIYLEHNPPTPHAAETRHFFQHDKGLLVHVTSYNALMWDNGDMPWRVIEHGVPDPNIAPPLATRGRGIVVVNHIHRRGRRMGADLFDEARKHVGLDLIGMDSENHGGLGEVPNKAVGAFMSQYRYFFSPVRYGSLGLALVEAMLVGLPVVGIATTELPGVVENGIHGCVDTRLSRLIDVMRLLEADEALAREWGEAARNMARRRFGIERFVQDWNQTLLTLVGAVHE